uniref:ninjurin-1 n=1 Tax=Monopterus albus TaxID=43700 RepID=UPI0009B49FD0|nr:ninjurin-1-like [Monopterus albus]
MIKIPFTPFGSTEHPAVQHIYIILYNIISLLLWRHNRIRAYASAALSSRLICLQVQLLFLSPTLCSSFSQRYILQLKCSIMMNSSSRSSSNRRSETEASHPDAWPNSPTTMNMNHYANKKSAAESMLDVALLLANASQLKAVLEQGANLSFYAPIITLISISLCLQVIVGLLLIFIVHWNLNDEQRHWRLNTVENVATGLVFIIVVVNIFITAFGINRLNRSN